MANKRIINICVIILVVFCLLGLSIAIIISGYYGYSTYTVAFTNGTHSQCDENIDKIVYWLEVASIINVIVGIGTLIAIVVMFIPAFATGIDLTDPDEGLIYISCYFLILSITLVSGIWAIITYDHKSSNCKIVANSKIADIWYSIRFYAAIGWSVIGVFLLIISVMIIKYVMELHTKYGCVANNMMINFCTCTCGQTHNETILGPRPRPILTPFPIISSISTQLPIISPNATQLPINLPISTQLSTISETCVEIVNI